MDLNEWCEEQGQCEDAEAPHIPPTDSNSGQLPIFETAGQGLYWLVGKVFEKIVVSFVLSLMVLLYRWIVARVERFYQGEQQAIEHGPVMDYYVEEQESDDE